MGTHALGRQLTVAQGGNRVKRARVLIECARRGFSQPVVMRSRPNPQTPRTECSRDAQPHSTAVPGRTGGDPGRPGPGPPVGKRDPPGAHNWLIGPRLLRIRRCERQGARLAVHGAASLGRDVVAGFSAGANVSRWRWRGRVRSAGSWCCLRQAFRGTTQPSSAFLTRSPACLPTALDEQVDVAGSGLGAGDPDDCREQVAGLGYPSALPKSADCQCSGVIRIITSSPSGLAAMKASPPSGPR